MLKTLEEAQVEFIKILSIAINLDGEEKDRYLKEQRKILQKDLAISDDKDNIKELECLSNKTSSSVIHANY